MKIIVTGSESFIGKELIKQCKKKKISVFLIDLIHGLDIRSPEIHKYLPKNADAIVHLAALSFSNKIEDYPVACFSTNVLGTLNLINTVKKNNIKRFIFASSEWIYGESKSAREKKEDSKIDTEKIINPYALSKIVSENNLRSQFLQGFCPTTILRFSIVYGPRKQGSSAIESLFNSVKLPNKVNVGSLKTARRFIHVTDVASGIMAVLLKKESGFKIYNLSSDKLISLREVINITSQVLNTKPSVFESDPDNFSIRNPSNKKFKNVFKWKPKINLQTGLKTLDA